MRSDRGTRVFALAFLSLIMLHGLSAAAIEELQNRVKLSDPQLAEIFAANHGGWSLDEVLLADERRIKVLQSARQIDPSTDEKALWEGLVRMRKAGKLKTETTQRANTDYGDTLPAAEIAARRLHDEFSVSFDQILVDPELLTKYDTLAQSIDSQSDVYTLRKAALRLRKSRQLKPELVTRVTEWNREIATWTLDEARKSISQLPSRPGIYIFRDATGYLYIGQSNHLRERLGKHLLESDRANLANYLASTSEKSITLELHIFGKGSPAEQTIVREAYESELIRTRKPRLNLAP
jgi:predicted GIY-YIG superfamily endonuclease